MIAAPAQVVVAPVLTALERITGVLSGFEKRMAAVEALAAPMALPHGNGPAVPLAHVPATSDGPTTAPAVYEHRVEAVGLTIADTNVRVVGACAPNPGALVAVTDGSIGGATVQTVNARELHAFLGVGKDFSNWVKDRIQAYDFVEGLDYHVFAGIGGNPSGGRPSKDYAITLDMAKELSMVERNEKGKQARQYFIECERRLRAPSTQPAFPVPQTMSEALRLAADLAEQKHAAESRAKALQFENDQQAVKIETDALVEASACRR